MRYRVTSKKWKTPKLSSRISRNHSDNNSHTMIDLNRKPPTQRSANEEQNLECEKQAKERKLFLRSRCCCWCSDRHRQCRLVSTYTFHMETWKIREIPLSLLQMPLEAFSKFLWRFSPSFYFLPPQDISTHSRMAKQKNQLILGLFTHSSAKVLSCPSFSKWVWFYVWNSPLLLHIRLLNIDDNSESSLTRGGGGEQ